ncbi:MAG TPA: cupin domain-containing protein [Solirubrobacteraceae bacterium]|nr:cupin domain-containing protein [Solirubrobacteraceae bacterium]
MLPPGGALVVSERLTSIVWGRYYLMVRSPYYRSAYLNTPSTAVKYLAAGTGRAVTLMGSILTFKDEPGDNGDALMMFEHRCPPGDGVPPHSEHNHEAFYGLDGVLEVEADGQCYRIMPGAFLGIPSGVVHSLHNPGPGWSRVLTLVSPGSQHARFFSTLGQSIEDPAHPPQPGEPLAFERVQEVAGSCGIDFLPASHPESDA